MKHKIKNLFCVLWSFLRFSVLKLFRFRSFSFWWVERFSPNTRIDFVKGHFALGRRVRAHHCTKMVINGGTLTIGDDVAINDDCGIYCFERITIGARTEFGPRVMIYDHDHDFRCDGGLKAGKYRTAPVTIGQDVWIGANAVILRGSTIGDGCVIGAGCVVKGVVPPGMVLTQKRMEELRPI